jgi:hypothetical protein
VPFLKPALPTATKRQVHNVLNSNNSRGSVFSSRDIIRHSGKRVLVAEETKISIVLVCQSWSPDGFSPDQFLGHVLWFIHVLVKPVSLHNGSCLSFETEKVWLQKILSSTEGSRRLEGVVWNTQAIYSKRQTN